jgi:hypothetical protein
VPIAQRRVPSIVVSQDRLRKAGHAIALSGVARTTFIELYMLKQEGQGDERIFTNRGDTETEGIQAIQELSVKPLPRLKMPDAS